MRGLTLARPCAWDLLLNPLVMQILDGRVILGLAEFLTASALRLLIAMIDIVLQGIPPYYNTFIISRLFSAKYKCTR